MASEASVSKDTIILPDYINIVPARVGLKTDGQYIGSRGKIKHPGI
jgi:hypothetical protein